MIKYVIVVSFTHVTSPYASSHHSHVSLCSGALQILPDVGKGLCRNCGKWRDDQGSGRLHPRLGQVSSHMHSCPAFYVCAVKVLILTKKTFIINVPPSVILQLQTE